MKEMLSDYINRFVGSVQGLNADMLPRNTPSLSDIPEMLVFKCGNTKYARVGSELLNLRNGRAVNPSSVIQTREGKYGVAVAVISALGNL